MTQVLEKELRLAQHEDLARVRVAGKFLHAGDEKLFLRGVTYGTFQPDETGSEFKPWAVEEDFAAMAAAGFNAVRVYTVPPRWLLDAAQRYGLRLLVGLPWAHHVAFLESRGAEEEVVRQVRTWVAETCDHPAVLAYALANEIPSSIVRWYGKRRVERFIERMYRAAKDVAPQTLLTYVNYPSTEYLELPFLDFVSFNVYLESPDAYAAYLARLQNLAGERPVVMTELGLDSQRNGELVQAESLGIQVQTTLNEGCAGAFVFGWTDEWHRGGFEVDDWDFGLTRRDRTAKPALASVSDAFAGGPTIDAEQWPRISVVVCTYNGARTIRDCLDGLMRVRYPDFEVIVVNDGSTDATPDIAAEYAFRLISTTNQGLSAARNEGMLAATGEIVAYTDDDARPDPDWLTYIARGFASGEYVGIGGPNIAPPGDGFIADCVANAPGGPVHVLLSDREAEHIPGCNMAFRREALLAIGGFDPRYRTAGDDVDVCWRLQERGGKLGFHAGAMVWHHRRNSVRTYWKQQVGYGRAEALLAEKWPEKYNTTGHLSWGGRLYGKGLVASLGLKAGRIYQGPAGSAPFQSVYQPGPVSLWSLSQMPEWFLVIAVLGAFALAGVLWRPLLFGAVPLLSIALALPLLQAYLSARRAVFSAETPASMRLKLRLLTAVLHVLQPLARLRGRIKHDLTPWRDRGAQGFAWPLPARRSVWTGAWRSTEAMSARVHAALRASGVQALRGGDFDRWDVEALGGWFAGYRVRLAVEEHGAGVQHFRFQGWPRLSAAPLVLVAVLGVVACAALLDGATLATALLALVAAGLLLKTVIEAGAARAVMDAAIVEATRPEETVLAETLATSDSAVKAGRP
jgi:GT2 family glycosyltransferase